ncbi:DMT family transporter [Paracoccus sp. p4-l81]|uniref:DMT family transporter n=1 Tax=Paracoccus sp. p4-l81 TaxID=3342806 RepID=UPI0035B7C14A
MNAAPIASLRQPDRVSAGMALMVLFCIIAPLIDVAAKLAAQTVPVGTVTLARFVVQALLIAPLVWALHLPMAIPRAALGLSVARAVLSIVSTLSFVGAVKVMPIADALAIAFVEPFIILLIGWAVLKEQVGPRRLAAAGIGFAGALLVIQPSFARFGLTAVLPLITAASFALYMLVTRHLTRFVHPVPMQMQTALIAVPLTLAVLGVGGALNVPALTLHAPQGIDWIWCAGVGIFATASHVAMAYALRFAPSATLAPLHYLEIVTATAFGWLVFGDFPAGTVWAGIAVIVGSGLYVIWREGQARPAPPPA